MADFEIAHLYPERGLVMTGALDELRTEALETLSPGSYRSTHGDVITAPEEVFRLLDTFLEKRLVEAFGSLEERKHWDDDEEAGPLPAGPGPYGSGIRALGGTGERIELAAGWNSRQLLASFAEEDEGPDDDAPHAREPWQEVIGDRGMLREWLCHMMRWTDNDGHFTMYPRTEQERAWLTETKASRIELADRLLMAFPPESSRYFIGGHAGWDRWSEDYLSRDEVIAFVSGDDVAVLWLSFYRFYG